jgi:4-hydroxybenzoate polyprenyltransferase
LERRAAQRARLGATFPREKSRLGAFVRALRPHHWVKNLIIFVPLLTSHQLTDPTLLASAGLAFLAFCLCASAVYMFNDLLDLDSDRQHPAKKLRPFASGELPLPAGLVAVPLLLVASVLVASMLSWNFIGALGLYFVLTTAYSWFLRQIALLDVFTLAGLYTLRLRAGEAATGIELSFWLLVFSMFIFLSLALVKRFVELLAPGQHKQPELSGRGYLGRDLELVASLGSSCGFTAVLVLALYVNSQAVLKLYHRPELLLLGCPILLFWISRVWLIAHRGQMDDDPIVFALRDWVSHLLGLLMLLVLWLAGRP